MPTYEYQCLDCNRKVEYFQSMKEAPRTVCPRCGGRLVRLVSSGAGLIFKGSGFYVTDYKKKETANHKHVSSRRSQIDHEDNVGKGKSNGPETDKAVSEQTEK